jgi:hypothetical protein
LFVDITAMRKNMKYVGMTMLIFWLTMPGCRMSDWGLSHFEQGDVRQTPKEMVLAHVRSAKIYDEFTTVGIFDALWLSDAVLVANADARAAKFAQDPEARDAYLTQQRIDNASFISFYVVSYMPNNSYPLADKQSLWSAILLVGDKRYEPLSVQSVDLSPEYLFFLDKILNRHKMVYLVKFARNDKQGKSILSSDTDAMKLWMSTVDRSVNLVWQLHDGRLVEKKDE